MSVMADPLITLTTDFGTDSPYVAAMKGVILTINPAARLIDLSHQIPPQNVRHAAYFLAESIPYFPAGTIHIFVVDPGVGTERRLLYAELAGQRLLAPDNGCWTLIPEAASAAPVIHLSEARYWRSVVSDTFHGRDIVAPVAAHLSLGISPTSLGPKVADWMRLQEPLPRRTPSGLIGEVVFLDHFGNLITNIPGAEYVALSGNAGRVVVGDRGVDRRVRTYGEATPGTLVSLVSSSGRLEIAEVNGNAARRLGVGVGAKVTVQ